MLGIVVMAGSGDYGGVAYTDALPVLTTDERRRAAIRVCLAGEVARVGATSTDDFDATATADVLAANDFANQVEGAPDEVLAEELEKVVGEVKALGEQIDALTDRLMGLRENELGNSALGAYGAAQEIGYKPVYDQGGKLIHFDPSM